MKRAVVLLSGGLDSATCLAIAQAEGFACYALSFAYGQRHSYELQAAQRVRFLFAGQPVRNVAVQHALDADHDGGG
ncbi:MAG: 7-cyano-7-deazaguanine synthase, partial [Deltaproteobacteria bacterium HGW-Deltaproteobacteria-22]